MTEAFPARAPRPNIAWPGLAGVLVPLLMGCGAQPERVPAEVDCSAEAGLSIYWIEDYELPAVSRAKHFAANGGTRTATTPYSQWYSFGDDTPGAIPLGTIYSGVVPAVMPPPASTPPVLPFETVPIPGGRCADVGVGNGMLKIISRGHVDWGSGFGEYGYSKMYPTCPTDPPVADAAPWADGSAYEGIAIWARTPEVNDIGNTDKTVIIGLNDSHTEALGGICEALPPYPTAVVNSSTQPGNCSYVTLPEIPQTRTCGNAFVRNLTVTSLWQLYLLPFNTFNQAYDPNRTSEPIDTSALYSPVIRTARGVLNTELWIDSIGFYSHDPNVPPPP